MPVVRCDEGLLILQRSLHEISQETFRVAACLLEMYSGPPMQNAATLTAFTNDIRRFEESAPAHGPGSLQ